MTRGNEHLPIQVVLIQEVYTFNQKLGTDSYGPSAPLAPTPLQLAGDSPFHLVGVIAVPGLSTSSLFAVCDCDGNCAQDKQMGLSIATTLCSQPAFKVASMDGELRMGSFYGGVHRASLLLVALGAHATSLRSPTCSVSSTHHEQTWLGG